MSEPVKTPDPFDPSSLSRLLRADPYKMLRQVEGKRRGRNL